MSFQQSAVSSQQKIEKLISEHSLRQGLIKTVWLAALVIYILAGTPIVPFHGDESTQIFMSRDYAYQFIQGNVHIIRDGGAPNDDAEQYLRLINGTINKYTIGLAWHIGGFDLADVNEQWDWGGDWDYNQRTGHAPTEALLMVFRLPSTLFLAAGVVVMFALGSELGGRATAYVASLYYALHPALLLNGRRAMMEGSMIFFGLLMVLAGVWFARRQTWLTAVLLGMASGLALASKHTNVFTVAAVFVVIGVRLLVQSVGTQRAASSQNAQRSVVGYMLAALLTLLVFYSLNPAWWNDPIGRASDVLRLRQELLDIQVGVFGGYENLLDKAVGFARQVFIALSQYYEVPTWSGYIGDQIARYEASVWRGVSIGGSLPGAALLLGMMGVGIWTLLRETEPTIRWLIGTWALVVIVTTLLLTPVEWQRYYLPIYPAVGLLAALGFTRLVRRFRT